MDREGEGKMEKREREMEEKREGGERGVKMGKERE